MKIKLERHKRLAAHKKVVQGELNQSRRSYYTATSVEELDTAFDTFMNTRSESRALYYDHSRMKHQRPYKFQKQRYIDRLCSGERQALKGKEIGNCPIIFIGDRGYGIGSTIKGHLKYGGTWKPNKHSHYTPVIETNEHNTSQNYPFCFQKLDHPYKQVTRKGKQVLHIVAGTFECQNLYCVRNIMHKACMARDATSALSIELSGSSRVAFGTPFPAYNERLSPSNTEKFNQSALLSEQKTGAGLLPVVVLL